MGDAGRRKIRGAFYTPPELVSYVTRWGIRNVSDTILEPSAGEAAFLLAAVDRLRELGGDPSAGQVLGTELHQSSAVEAQRRLDERGVRVRVDVGDFLTRTAEPRFDVCIGNPPYVRYQDFTGSARAAGQRAALAAGVRLSGLASAWAPFVIHAAEHVREGGRLGLVLPAELLSVGYAAEVRQYLLKRFLDVRIIAFRELVFPDVLEEVVLLLAEGAGPSDNLRLYQADNASELPRVADTPWTTASPQPGEKWTGHLLNPSSADAYQSLLASNGFASMSQAWGKAGLGAVTGNNRWFTLSRASAQRLGLTEEDLVKISPPGSKHLRGLTFSHQAWESLASDGQPVLLFASPGIGVGG